MSDRHEHDWWATPMGGMTCACGASRRPVTPVIENEKESK